MIKKIKLHARDDFITKSCFNFVMWSTKISQVLTRKIPENERFSHTYVLSLNMSQKSSDTNEVLKAISDASTNPDKAASYLSIRMDNKVPTIFLPNYSIGGAVGKWRKTFKEARQAGIDAGEEEDQGPLGNYFFWPQFRLSGDNIDTMVRFAHTYGLISDDDTKVGPIIFRSGSSNDLETLSANSAEADYVTVGMIKIGKNKNRTRFGAEDLAGMKGVTIPQYDIEYTEGSKAKHTLTSVPKAKPSWKSKGSLETPRTYPMSPSDYIAWEKEIRSIRSGARNVKRDEEADLEKLAMLIALETSGGPRKGSRSSKTGRTRRSADTAEQELANRLKTPQHKFNVTSYTSDHLGGKATMHFTSKLIMDPQNDRVIFQAPTAEKRKELVAALKAHIKGESGIIPMEGPLNWFRYVTGSKGISGSKEEKEALNRYLDAVVQNKVLVTSSPAKGKKGAASPKKSVKKSKTETPSKKSSIKKTKSKKPVTPVSASEEEEEE